MTRSKKIISGIVVQGKQLGRTIGFPTANLQLTDCSFLQQGVYGVRVKYKNRVYMGLLNIGTCPTVQTEPVQTVEVHIVNFNQMIYGEQLDIDLAFRLRDEKKFPSLDGLIEQLRQDLVQTVGRFSSISSPLEVV